jgi:glyoxylase-like metal-dependent hydrolase (beta-lactamase superfamily II)
MPIKPENKARYPANWKQIRLHILSRAHYRCEHEGCGAEHRSVGYWLDGQFVRLNRVLRDAGYQPGSLIACADGRELKVIRIVLTIAHLDHTPENCAEENLRAWCQRHHLAYDAEHHKRTAYATRKAAAGTLDLFDAL